MWWRSPDKQLVAWQTISFYVNYFHICWCNILTSSQFKLVFRLLMLIITWSLLGVFFFFREWNLCMLTSRKSDTAICVMHIILRIMQWEYIDNHVILSTWSMEMWIVHWWHSEKIHQISFAWSFRSLPISVFLNFETLSRLNAAQIPSVASIYFLC